jgi:hypothetical protein
VDKRLEEKFSGLWDRHFPGAELPIVFYYTDGDAGLELGRVSKLNRCLVANLAKIREGAPARFGAESMGCSGGKRYCGFSHTLRENFNYFLSYGIPGELEGERYKKTPELVDEGMAKASAFTAPKPFIVFKRWDLLEDGEAPDAAVFFASPDVLAGLFTLANYDEAETAVIAPFGAGCASIVEHPWLENRSPRPRCVLGMFDPSARPYVPENTLSFAVPMKKFARMIENMEESFLITDTWDRMRKRIGRATGRTKR